ncbi:terminase [Aestuariivirga litoralis]|uniref:Terminase n=1 Tax=Aestuariivirga litoralis TaxID=2650924 RepID=A0A2W2C6U6_9HYPH|nr:phage terminase large subunit [Aestuariivirga litoralis]PZF75873.1 terminase [Aestuariivirga litoralis]
MTSSRALLLAALRDDFLVFLAYAVPILRQGAELEVNWVIDALGAELRRVTEAETLRLIVNMPPRSMKSTIVSVAFLAWWLGHNPSARIICASYNDGLARALAGDFRRLVSHPLFNEIFPDFRLDPAKNTETEVRTKAGGYRLATTVGGTLTGRGADVIVVDDPLNAVNAYSASEREKVNHWFDTALLSRLDNRGTGAVIVVMQRLHEGDLTGHLLEKGGWRELSLPARNIDGDRRFPLLTGGTHLWPAGADLMPTRLPATIQLDLLASMGEAAFSAQYLQRPVPEGGNIVKTEWFQSYATAPQRSDLRYVVHSYDVATRPSLAGDYTVCTVWGMTHRGDYYLLDCRRVRLAFPDLLRLARELIRLQPPTHVLVEDAANGTALYQELQRERGFTAELIRPRHDKEARLHAATPIIEAGRVYLPETATWRVAYLAELTGFPGTRHDDQVDSTSQFLNWAEERHRRPTLLPEIWSLEKEDPWLL